MKLAVFGATGATGRIIVGKALAAGHAVTVLARNPASMAAAEHLTVVQGDAADAAAVDKVVAGQDVVLFAIGSGSMKPSTVRTDTARTVATAMKHTGVRRIIAMSGMGAGDSYGQLPWIMRAVIAPLVLKALLKDQDGLERSITESGVEEWILLRPGQLKDGASTGGKPSLAIAGLKSAVARTDIADFMLANLESRAWVNQAPMIG